MIRDPIVEEIHKVREQLLADCNDNLDFLLDRYKSSEDQDRNRMVSLQDVQRKSRRVSRSTTSTDKESNPYIADSPNLKKRCSHRRRLGY